MSRYKSRTRFDTDVSGSVGTIFALSFIPMILMAGAAIDYSRSLTQWSNLQQATDATALTVAHQYLTAQSTQASLMPFAQTYINGLMTGATVTSALPTTSNTVVCISTTSSVPTVLMRIANILSVPVSTSACSQVGQTYEVALALDNSGSMNQSLGGGQSKIATLQTAANQLLDILIPQGTLVPQVAISLVPFTSLVNVGPGNQNAAFMDTGGNSSIHWQNFHRPSGTGDTLPVSKFDLFTSLYNSNGGNPNLAWGGCVEEPPQTSPSGKPTGISKDVVLSSNPDALFVPYFAPDEPGAIDLPKGSECYPSGTNCSNNTAEPWPFQNSYIADNGSSTTGGTCSPSSKYAIADNYSTAYPGDGQTNIYPRSGMSMVCKYPSATVQQVQLDNNNPGQVYTGPNEMCLPTPLTPLTTDRTALQNGIKAMNASGGYNTGTAQSTGFMWAWRSISPNTKPFPTASTAAIGPQNPKSYTFGPPPNNKIIILMSDGANAWSSYNNPFGSVYEGYGYQANQRLSNYSNANPSVPGSYACSGNASNVAQCQLDNVLLEACNNAKTLPQPITIYTIGFGASGNAAKVLKACSSGTKYYYSANNNAALQAAFVAIANSIESLRLSL